MLRINPLSYVRRNYLIFQHQRTVRTLQLTQPVWRLLREFYHLPWLAHRSVDPGAIGPQVEALIEAGVVIEQPQVSVLLATEQPVRFALPDPNLVYFMRAAADAGIRWWFESDSVGPILFFTKEIHRSSVGPRLAAYFLDDALVASSRVSIPRRGRWFAGESQAIGDICRPKMVLNHLFRAWSIPVPRQMTLAPSVFDCAPRRRTSMSSSIRSAVQLQWGPGRPRFPLVLKPAFGSLSCGATPVRSMDDLVRTASHLHRTYKQPVVLEQFVPGREWRVFVLADGHYAVYRRCRATVTGDGNATVRNLIASAVSRRQALYSKRRYMRRVHRPHTTASGLRMILDEQELSLDSVVARRRRVHLSFMVQTMDVENTAVDSTDVLPPERVEHFMAIRERLGAARLGLDVIGRTLGGSQYPKIIEVNALPYVERHEEPDRGKPRPVALWTVSYFLDQGLSANQIKSVHEQCRSARAVQ